MKSVIQNKNYKVDFCVVGGGLAGTIAAISAARKGVKVALIQDRPVLGGNSSSEVKMWVRGALGPNKEKCSINRETGILEEFEEENFYTNSTLSATGWDTVLYGKVKQEKNIQLFLNCSCIDCQKENNKIKSVKGWQLTTYTYITVEADYFADCSGDSILAELSGANYTIGRESKYKYGESLAGETDDLKTMGSSCLIQARETDHFVKFTPPKWAYKYPDESVFESNINTKYSFKRDHEISTSGDNLWWIELGGDSDSLHDYEDVKDELIKTAYGVWDHIKNYGNHNKDNWELEWIGFLPGKRETLRYVGDYVLTSTDILSNKVFDDEVAYGGWPLDDHNPKGFKTSEKNEIPSVGYPVNSPYSIPYRILYSNNIENLFFAGRNISVTHLALSSTRVMGTCSILGQAVGNAVSLCKKYSVNPRQLIDNIGELQQEILKDGVFLPNVKRKISKETELAKLNIGDSDREILFNGIDRPRSEKELNFIQFNKGESLIFSFEKPQKIGKLRLLFDLDYSRKSTSNIEKIKWFPMKLFEGKDFEPVKVPNTIVKSFDIFIDGKLFYSEKNNYNSLVFIEINKSVKNIKIKFNETFGYEKVNVFGADFV